ncbi:parvulin-like peptidyl-prolyl isomerase [Methylophilaceae bacterium 11]|uniref:SurA N-terminal domain-containing protein n=1 Tax=Methylotenera sp. N17 TaxID=1502761 RepID=UPI00044C5B51|nr:SurA N-terminal domain-containing protein [Methylotenera sp. N17]EUJ10538.1 parvulin-like peptidyl-prolyl isomerase [Methylophilaceae bacterium 11]
MLDAIRKHTQGWLAKAILAIITVPFALFGIDSYLNQAGGNVAVATVAGEKISVQEFSNSIESVRNRLQSEGQKVDAALLDSPALKQSVLDGLITRRLVNKEVQREHFKISDEQLNQHILSMPEFQENGKFSEDLYQKTLQQNKLTAAKFESGIRSDMVTQQARDGIAKLAFAPKAIAEKALQFAFQQREVSTVDVKAVDYIKQVTVTPEQVKQYYEQHKDKFKVPEQVKLEFALLSAAGLMNQVSVSDQEVKEFYDANAAKFQGDEQRQASHILINFGQDKAAAKTKALDVLAQVKKNPKRFEELAITNSQDTGTATKGGDLGSFGRGAMVKPFEDAVFAMKVNQVSDLVESEFGYHIIKLNGVTGQSSSFDQMKPQIKAELIFQKAQAKYAELSEDFSNMVYEQSASLAPVAKKYNLQLQTTQLMSRADGAKYFKSDKLMNMAFSDEVLKEKRNSEAVEVSPNNLVSVRVVEYKPEAPRSFDEVKSGIEAVLKLEQAVKLASDKGASILAKLKSGDTKEPLDWISSVIVDRKNAQGLSNGVMNQVFRINTDKLPAYAGFLDENKTYVIVKVIGVSNQLGDDADSKQTAASEYEAAVAAEYVSAYAASLRAKENIKVNTSVLFSKAE